jgi:Ca2+-binding RTX toxin-like protein
VGRFASLWVARRSQWQNEVRSLLAMCAESALPQIGMPMVQNLEGRVLMSSATLSNGVLSLIGDSGSGNSLTVDIGAGGTYYVNVDGHVYYPAASSVKSISITGGSGNDLVYVNPSIKLSATINTFNGNDIIKAVGSNNTITVGDGNNLIYSSGNIHAGNGNDTVWASAAPVTIVAGNGRDLLVGGAGNDLLTVGTGASTLIGGLGKDTFVASSNTVIADKQAGESVTITNSSPSTGGSATPSSGSGSTSANTPPTPAIVSAIVTGTTLFVTGSSTAANNLSVDLQSNGGFYANADGRTISTIPGVVKSIVVTGGAASDLVWINPSIKVPATINTYGGNDLIKGGGGYDAITTGDGNSTVYASGKITVGNGNNVVWVGSTGSSVTAGNGNDLLVGGPGNDTITAGSGHSTLIGGAGADVLTATSNASFPDATSQDKVVKNSVGGSTGGVTTPPSTTPPTVPTAPSGTVKISGENETVYGSNHGDSTAPTPVIVLLGLGGQAEHSVFVDALSSSLGSGTVLTATYKWTFGDPNGAYNTLVGWNAGHIYDNPGTYTIVLTITNVSGKSSSLSTTVTVGASTRRTIYVDSVYGNDNNNGLSASSPVKTGIRASQLITDNTAVLFRRGESFNSSNYFYIGKQNVVIGAYGTGANPIMMKQSSADHGVFYIQSTADQVVIENLIFDSVFKPVGVVANEIDAVGIYPSGRNITVRNNTFLNINTAVDAYMAPTGMLLQNNTAPDIHGLRGYFEWMNGSEQVIVGNTVVNSTREHVMRSSFASTSKILITDNNFANPSDAGGDSGDSPKTPINIRDGSYVDIENNQLSQGTVSIGPDDALPENTVVSWIKLNGNTFTNSQIQIHGSVQHMLVSNNVTDYSFYPDIIIQTVDPVYASRVMSDITIDHNTGILSSALGFFLEVDGDKYKNIITVTNNLFAAPNFEPGSNGAASVYILANTAGSIAYDNNNVWAPATGVSFLAPNAVNLIGSGTNMNNFVSASQWNALPNVGTDFFERLTASSGKLTTPGINTFIGAVLPAAIVA